MPNTEASGQARRFATIVAMVLTTASPLWASAQSGEIEPERQTNEAIPPHRSASGQATAAGGAAGSSGSIAGGASGSCADWGCATLYDLKGTDPRQYTTLQNFCVASRLAGKLKPPSEKEKEDLEAAEAAIKTVRPENGPSTPPLTGFIAVDSPHVGESKFEGKSLAQVCWAVDKVLAGDVNAGKAISIINVNEVFSKNIAPMTCSGFGLTVPLYSIRYTKGDKTIKGPIAAGLGGGYYLSVGCSDTVTWGPEFFGYSEGLDPSGLFHLGAAAGLQLVVFKKFSFGVAAAYDLYRHQAAVTAKMLSASSGGLFAGPSTDAFSWLITFNITQSDGATDPKKGDPTDGK